MTEMELRKYYEVITDAWKLFKDHATPVSDDQFWQDMMRQTNELHIKHGKTLFSERILNTVISEIEQLYKHPRATTERIEQVSIFSLEEAK